MRNTSINPKQLWLLTSVVVATISSSISHAKGVYATTVAGVHNYYNYCAGLDGLSDCTENDLSYGVGLGKRFNPSVALEASYNRYGEVSSVNSGYSQYNRLSSIALDSVFSPIPLDASVSLYALAGINLARMGQKVNTVATSHDYIGYRAGLGLGYSAPQLPGVQLNLEFIAQDIQQQSATTNTSAPAYNLSAKVRYSFN